MLWVDKHRPTTLDKCDYHTELCERLLELASKTDIPHMMFYGPSGAGKKTRVMGFLRAVFGSGVEKLKLEHRSVKTPSRRTVEITTVASSYHIEMNPGDAGMYDRFIVQEVIKEIASSRNLDSKHAFKVVVLTEADQLTRDAQAALRRTMEKHSATCRLILLCNNPSKVIDPVRSRCLGIRVPAPSVKDMMDVMTGVAGKEGLTLPRQMAVLVANKSGRNMRRALLMLEASKVQNYPFKPDQQIAVMDWEQCIAGIAVDIVAEQSPSKLLHVRGKLYELLVNCIPPETIFTTLLEHLLPKLSDALRHDVTHWAAHYQHTLTQGTKEVFHLEAFIARAMQLYKQAATDAMTAATTSTAAAATAAM